MPTNREPALPLACVPGAIPAAEREAHAALTRTLFAETLEGRPHGGSGYDFRFPPVALERIARFVRNERLCCPFLTFRIDVPARDGTVRLRLRGPGGTTAFLEEELPLGTRGRGQSGIEIDPSS